MLQKRHKRVKNMLLKCLVQNEVYSIIRDNNTASQNVAKRNGMKEKKRFVKHYYGMDMPHIVYSVRNEGM